MNTILFGEALNKTFLMFTRPSNQIVCYSDIQRAMALTGRDVKKYVSIGKIIYPGLSIHKILDCPVKPGNDKNCLLLENIDTCSEYLIFEGTKRFCQINRVRPALPRKKI
jgi:hypothetical protein